MKPILENWRKYLSEDQKDCKLPNRGDIAEGIVAAAIAAKISHRASGIIGQVMADDIFYYIHQLNNRQYSLKVADFDGEHEDNIIFSISMPAKAYTALIDPSLVRCLMGEYEGAAAYVNSIPMHKFATRLASNGKSNKIEIKADGTGDQKGTKVDIFITVDGQLRRNLISLKVKGGDQFAQKVGKEFSAQSDFWEPLGINIDEAEEQYNSIVTNIPAGTPFSSREEINSGGYLQFAKDATGLTYGLAYKKLKSLLDRDSGETNFIEKLTDYITHGATGDEAEFIELVKILDGSFKRARFGDKFKRKMKEADLYPAFEITKAGYPQIKIIMKDEDGNETLLVQLRAKVERASSITKKYGKRYGVLMRNYLEAGDALYELAKI